MKKTAFTLLLTLATTVGHAQTHTGDLTLRSQTEIDNFNFIAVTGNLTIDDAVDGNITNLNGLDSLTDIGGNLNIRFNFSLMSLSGLESLTDIGGFLNIVLNSSLTSLSGLESLTEIGGYLNIESNDFLPSLSGLDSLTDIGGNLNIRFNSALTSLSGLESLTEIGGYLNVNTNDFLISLSGLESLTEIGGFLTINNNFSLMSLSGLEMLDSIGGTLTITENTVLTDFCAVSSLIGDDKQITMGEYTVSGNSINPTYGRLQEVTYCDGSIFFGDLTLDTQDSIDVFRYRVVTGNLTIDESVANDITNLDGLNELTNIGGFLNVINNASLTSLSGLDSLTDIGGNLSVRFNPSLISLSGLASLTEIGGYLSIRFNPSLMSLNGLGSLTEIGEYLDISSNYFLMSLSGLSSLTEIGGYLTINNNSSLMSLSGLESLHSTGDTLIVTGNRDLADFCVISSLIGDDKQITSGDYTVNTNSYNPPYTLIDDENYCSNADGGIFVGNLTLETQASIDTFSYRRISGNLTINDAANGNITNLDSLSGLTEIQGFLSIGNNASLPSLSGLDSLTEIGGYLDVRLNASLMSLSGLASLTDIGGYLDISSNDSLMSLSGLDSLTEIGGYLRISSNDSLMSLNGLASLTEIGGYLTIQFNNALSSLSGLGSLTEIQGYLTIFSNASLTSLSGLDTLTNIGGNLSIAFNSTLMSLNGLEMLDSIGDTLNITGNTALTDFCAISSLIGDDKQITSTEYTLNTNGYNPSFEEIQSRCSTNPPAVVATLQNVTTRSTVPFATINVAPAFSAPNRDTLTYTATSSDESIITVAVTDSTLTLTEVSTGMATITVTASDAFGLSVDTSFMVTITPNNPPVVENPLAAIESVSGTAFETIDISATFSDPDGDTLTYTVASSDTAIVTAALNNTILTLTETGKGMAIITVTATDVFGLSVDASFVAITNTAPTVATALTDVSIESGAAFETIDLSATFSDPNGDTLTYTVASSDAAIVTAALNNTILTLTETGKGTATITVTASDAFGLSVDTSFMVTITNTAPTVATALTDVSIESGTAFAPIDISATFSDPNGDTLTYTVASSDAAIVTAALNNTILTLTETGKGTATITVTASDGIASDSSAFMVTITNTAPTVATPLTDVSIESGTAFETIDLSATFSDPNGDALTYTVASSDAAIVTAALNNTILTLTETGKGTATITVTASDGIASDSSAFMVTITNTAPTVATALTDVSIESGTAFETIDLSATFSDPNGDALTYTVASSDAAIVTAALNNTILTLTETGKGTATITVTASDGIASDSSAFMVTITNTAPTVATALTDVSIESGTAFETIDLSATFSDPNGDALTYTVASSDAAIVTASLNNTILTLTETGKGTATITVTASDGIASDSSAFMVTITNTAPTVATALTDVSIESGTAFETIDLSATFSDPNGDALTYTVASSDAAIVTAALNNTILTLTETGKGTATITVTASDGIASDSSAFMVTITNTAPTVATALTDVSIESGTAFETIDLSATFSDPNGDALTYTVASSDAAIVTAALNNTILTLTETGKGTATITVTASDGIASDSSAFMVTITNTAPTVATALTDVSIESGTAFETIDLSATFSDPNGDALTYTVASSDAAIVTAALNNTILTLTEAGKGMATITVTASDGIASDSSAFMVTITNTAPTVATALTDVSIESGAAFETIDLSATFSDPDGDTLTYTVASSDTAIVTAALNNTILTLTETGKGTATITVTASDAFGLSVDTSFMVTITNTAPTVATALTDVSIESGTAFETIDLSATFSDPNGDALTYTVASSDAAIVTAALNNTILTLTETGKGTATITVTASDGIASDSSAFMVTITNTAPTVATALTDVSIESGTAFETIDLSATFSDPNGDALTYTVASSDAAIVTAALNNTILTLTETGKGTATITVTASDGIASDSSAFMVTITNTAPTVATALTDVSIESGTAFATIDLSATFSDPNGDALTYTVASSDAAIVTAALNNTILTLTETGKGMATITVTASDGIASDSSAFMVTITNTTPTVATALTDVSIESGTAFATIDLSATFSDPNGDALTYTVASSDATIVTAALNNTILTLTETGKGTATITVTASDGIASDSSAFMVTITNTAPTVATALTDVSIESGTAFETIDLSATFSDPNGDALTYTVASSDAAIVTAALNNTILTLTETGKGTATITVTASDGIASDSSAFMVTITNTAPTVATALTDVSIESGTAFATIDLSATFSDPNGDALTYTVASSDAAIVTAALNNTILTLTETGKGTATITVTASDGIASDSSAFMVTITNTAPTVATALTDVSIESGTAFATIDLSATFSDPNGDALTYTVASSDAAIVTAALNNTILTLTETGKGTATITVTASDAFGLSVDTSFMVTITSSNRAPVVVNPLMDVEIVSGSVFGTIDISSVFSDPDDDALTYRANSSIISVAESVLSGTTLSINHFSLGTSTITVTATDGDGASVDETFMVAVTGNVNQPPTVVTPLADVISNPGEILNPIDIATTFNDPENFPLSYTVSSSDETVVTATISGTDVILTQGIRGGESTITVTAIDGGSRFVSDQFTVTITTGSTNIPPIVATPLADVMINSGEMLNPINISTNFSDLNNEPLTYTATSSDENVVTVDLNSTTLTLTEVSVGTATITVTATDGDGASVDETFMVTITFPNRAPVVVMPLAAISKALGAGFEDINVSTVFNDPDNEPLTYTATSSDENVVTVGLNSTTLTLTEVSVGTATITVTATDGDGASVDETFMVTISSSTNVSPMRTTATFISALTVNIDYAGPPTSLIPFFMDSDGDVLTFSVESSDTTIVTAEIVNESSFNFTPVSIGRVTLTITATDPGGLSASETTILTIIAAEELALGIADIDILAVYPNPSSGLFQLSRTTDVVRVYDMSGRLVFRSRNTKQLDLTSHPSGQYLVEVRIGKERGRYTIIRE